MAENMAKDIANDMAKNMAMDMANDIAQKNVKEHDMNQAKLLLATNKLTIDEISTITGLSVEEIEKVK